MHCQRHRSNLNKERKPDHKSCIKIILKSVDSLQLQVAVFIICLIQSLTEGFILAPGSFHFTMFWVLLSRMKSACDSCDKVKPYYEHRVI